MPTFKINSSCGTINHAKDSKKYTFTYTKKNEVKTYDDFSKKIEIDNQNIIVYSKRDGWIPISLNSVKEDENWCGWKSFFSECERPNQILIGNNMKNEKFCAAYYQDDGRIILCSKNNVVDIADDELTMAIVQRNSTGTTRFDVIWCVHKLHKIIESVFHKSETNTVLSFLDWITDNVFDIGPDPYDWKQFLKMQKDQEGDENDWIGVFSPLTDEDSDDSSYHGTDDEECDEEECDEEEYDFTDTDSSYDSECSWDNEMRPLKKLKR